MAATILTVAIIFLSGALAVHADIDSCFTSMMINNISGNVSCDNFRTAVICVLREAGLTSSTLAMVKDLSPIKSRIDELQTTLGISCSIDYDSLIKELPSDGSQEGDSTDDEFDDDKTVDECENTFINKGLPSCSLLSSSIKCMIRVKNLDTNYSDDVRQFIQTNINNIISQLGLTCEINMDLLVNQVRQKRQKDNNSGSNFRPFHLFILMTFTCLSVIVLY